MATEETKTSTNRYKINITLLSDATFGRGDGVAGLVNQEVEHDALGLPFLRGRTLKGLLSEECANILFTLSCQNEGDDDKPVMVQWHASAQRLFGSSGSGIDDAAWVHYGNAQLPEPIRQAVAYELGTKERHEPALQKDDIIESLTAIRRQTALDEMGVPIDTTLRAMRVVLRSTPFESELVFQHSILQKALLKQDLALLGACVRAWTRAGTGRNRGRGRLMAALHSNDERNVTQEYLEKFQELTNDPVSQKVEADMASDGHQPNTQENGVSL